MEKSVSRTFAVSKVRPATQPLPVLDGVTALQSFVGTSVEACSAMEAGRDGGGPLVAELRSHPLIGALHGAFTRHQPLGLSPDIVWLTLTQGLAQHVNANAESLRQHFVKHEGKLNLVVERDDFVKGSPGNAWPEAFGAFSQQIHGYIGAAHALIVADFSTTGAVERAASEVVLLDAMQSYFSYEVVSLCGIPSITLEGTVDDWKSLKARAQKWSEYDLAWWIQALEPILDEFIAAASGVVRREFWESIYKWNGPDGSGGPYVTGWIVNLYPYLTNPLARRYPGTPPARRSDFVGRKSEAAGPSRDQLPALPAKAPFIWNYLGTRYKMEFIGGLVGVRQDPQTLCLRPEIGWAVRDEDAPKIQRPRREDLEAIL